MAPRLTVIGTVFVDVKGFPSAPLDPRGRNLGRAEVAHGGVGRNVAETLALLGAHVTFVSSVSDDGMGADVLARLARTGVETRWVERAAHRGAGVWLAILDRGGELALSLSQMPDVAHIGRALERGGTDAFAGRALAVLEVDLSPDLARRALDMARQVGTPVCGLPGNLDVLSGHPELLGLLEAFVCNEAEAARLTGLAAAERPLEAAAALAERGPGCAVVTLGARGAAVAARGRPPALIPAAPARVVDTSGAGDSFTAGFAYGLAAGFDPLRSARLAAQVAAWTVESAANVCPDLPARRAALGLG